MTNISPVMTLTYDGKISKVLIVNFRFEIYYSRRGKAARWADFPT
ncbi:hypothetical protein [Aulosira sp. FACHB-615]|nr:hypothetical protein [Aulosira sp. FACHB-615]